LRRGRHLATCYIIFVRYYDVHLTRRSAAKWVDVKHASLGQCSRKVPRRWTEPQVGDPYDLAVQRVVGVEPIFVVSDVPRAVAHYEQLGFRTSHHDEGYAFAHRDELTIHLAGRGADPERVGGGSIYMHVDDADGLAEEWRGAGVDLVEPKDYEYGKREGSHVDPDGNLIRFGSPLRR
jgi:catechol 2,3-dioxygenase-like lactoylglutathione lyase family enzyme